MVLGLLSAYVERFSVSCMRNFFNNIKQSKIWAVAVPVTAIRPFLESLQVKKVIFHSLFCLFWAKREVIKK